MLHRAPLCHSNPPARTDGKRSQVRVHSIGVDGLYDLETDPHEVENLAADPDPEIRALLESVAPRLFEEVWKTGDHTLANTDYPTVRYAPVGPHRAE